MLDTRRTERLHDRAIVKEGLWKSIAEEKLGAWVKVVAVVRANLKTTSELLTSLDNAVSLFDITADKFIGKQSDVIWNHLGRPGDDPGYDLIFPNGIAAYTEGPNDEQPDRMDLFAEFLELGVHSGIDPTLAKEIAAETRKMSTDYRAKVDVVPDRPSSKGNPGVEK